MLNECFYLKCVMLSGWCYEATRYSTERNTGCPWGVQGLGEGAQRSYKRSSRIQQRERGSREKTNRSDKKADRAWAWCERPARENF